MIGKLILALLATTGFLASAAQARELPAGPEFCAVAPTDLLVALDGNWKLKQGAGFAFGGAMAGMPLPPHKPQTLKIRYDADTGTTRMSAPDAPDNMVMFPVAEAQQVQAAGEITQGAIDAYQSQVGACDWYSLPIIVGTNRYALDREASEPDYDSPVQDQFYCKLPSEAIGLPSEALMVLMQLYNRVCLGDEGTTEVHGQMSMTLLVRFDSTDSGRGTLFFEGEMQGYEFAAVAPVTLAR